MADVPTRVQLSRRRGWRMPENTVSVARPGSWGNPWRVGRDGDAAHCVAEFRRLLTGIPVDAWPGSFDDTLAAIRMGCDQSARAMLAGKNLACWCPLDAPCHADVLLEVSNG